MLERSSAEFSAMPRLRRGAYGLKFIMAVFVVALAFDLIARLVGILGSRAVRRLFAGTLRHRPAQALESGIDRISPHTA